MSSKYLPSVVTPQIGGVRVERHKLDVEVHRLAHLLRSAGKRLQRAFAESAAQGADGDKALPQGHLELLEWHAKTCKWLLAEQRARAMLAPETGLETMSEAQYQSELRALARETIQEMDDDDLAGLLVERETKRSQ